ncbi:YebC/PmpR family DNA-binding transcriptional regulator [Patescibacteria group bacterium]
MSGHSKWSTIKHQKETKDKKRGTLFTKLGRAITIAVKESSNDNPESNFSLRLAIDKARAANMPNENIKKSVQRGMGKAGKGEIDFKEVSYDGFGPEKIAFMVECLTDNTNRTVAEIKKIFETRGGTLASPGSTAYLFVSKGLLSLQKQTDPESQMLRLIDLGVTDLEEKGEEIWVYVEPNSLEKIKGEIAEAGFKVISIEFVKKPQVLIKPKDKNTSQKIKSLLENLEAHDDVLKVWSNLQSE